MGKGFRLVLAEGGKYIREEVEGRFGRKIFE